MKIIDPRLLLQDAIHAQQVRGVIFPVDIQLEAVWYHWDDRANSEQRLPETFRAFSLLKLSSRMLLRLQFLRRKAR